MSRPPAAIGFATTDEVDELARLRFALYEEQDGTVAESLEVYRERFADFAARALVSDDWRAWVARLGDRPVGAMWLHTVHRVPVPGKRAGPIGYLTNVYVVPEHRSTGLGAEMLGRITAWCRQGGVLRGDRVADGTVSFVLHAGRVRETRPAAGDRA
ncbi:MAG TPA: GNAT family N-acetyltransferase [Actinomycetota bacterium]